MKQKKRDLVGDIMAWESGEMSSEDEKVFFQGLVNTGQAWRLQGVYGRQAQAMIDAGIIHYPKKHSGQSSTDYYGNPIPTHKEHMGRLKDKLKREARAWS